jgi:hypothetical protein
MKPRLLKSILALTLLISVTLTLSPLAAAQAAQAELTGEVRDENGAVVTSVRLTLTASEMNRTVTTTTGESGIYTFTNLTPGTYTLTAEAGGFKRFVRDGIRLLTGEPAAVFESVHAGEGKKTQFGLKLNF